MDDDIEQILLVTVEKLNSLLTTPAIKITWEKMSHPPKKL